MRNICKSKHDKSDLLDAETKHKISRYWADAGMDGREGPSGRW
jgi:hypothetical protein